MAIPHRGVLNQASAAPAGRRPAASLRPLQARSQATREALLATGRALLAQRELDSIGIADIAAAAGLSVGSFYGRFQDKEAYFEELQTQVTQAWREQAQQLLAELVRLTSPPACVVMRACALTVQLMRTDSGFLRSALKHASTHPTSWTPIKQVAQEMVDSLVNNLAPLLTHLRPEQRAARIRFGMQLVYGTCLNAVLHDPGPLALHDPRLARELARVMNLYLELAPVNRRKAKAMFDNTPPGFKRKVS
jgi:AcrR family transcriptional regulator